MRGKEPERNIVLIEVFRQQRIAAVAAVALGLSATLGTVLPASAYLFETYILHLEPSDELTRESIQFTISNDADEVLYEGNYTIAASIRNVRVCDPKGLLQHSSSFRDGSSTITYRYRSPLAKGDRAEISISFEVPGMVGKSTVVDAQGVERQDRIVNAAFLAPAPIRRFEARVDLPEEAWLARSLNEYATPTGSPLQPTDANVTSDGTNLRITWVRLNLSPGDRFDFFVAYRFQGPAIRIPVWAIALAAGAGAAVAGACSFLLLRRRAVQTKTERTLALLEEGERRVLKILLDAGGEMRQDDLMRITGYSKARISQLVTHLEKLGLIRKERFERTNKLYLTGEVRGT